MRRRISLVIAAVLLTGCYHATIDTGLAPSPQTINQPWAHGFIFGLVPPKTVESKAQCPKGAAKVETQLSFLNGLASAVTFSLYTPMTITVTCAQ